MTVRSAGILLYRRATEPLEVWIAHMGGPFWARKELRAWTIPKGEFLEGEDPLAAARREFTEEMGTPPPPTELRHLGDFRQPSRKIITVYAAEADFQPERISSNTFPLEWPRGSGEIQDFPEIDRAEWCAEPEARSRLVAGQVPILDALLHALER
ncbi:MAG: NUDIX domain-containing protein [Sinomonas sp.]|nr:NUDIX domain-containing protein [Sinomonas sp.]